MSSNPILDDATNSIGAIIHALACFAEDIAKYGTNDDLIREILNHLLITHGSIICILRRIAALQRRDGGNYLKTQSDADLLLSCVASPLTDLINKSQAPHVN